MDIMKLFEGIPGQVGFYYRNLVTGETLSYGADKPLIAASVIKIPILVEVFQQIEKGVLSPCERVVVSSAEKMPSCGALSYMHDGLEVTLEDLYTLMIILSDNTATNLLIRRLGMEAVNRTMHELGLDRIVLRRLLFDSRAEAAGLSNVITARAIGLLLEKMYGGILVSPAASEAMLGILKKQRLNGKIPFLLPRDTMVAHKTGEDENITHDVGIVWAEKPFVVCFCSNGVDVPGFERVIQEVSRVLYDAARP